MTNLFTQFKPHAIFTDLQAQEYKERHSIEHSEFYKSLMTTTKELRFMALVLQENEDYFDCKESLEIEIENYLKLLPGGINHFNSKRSITTPQKKKKRKKKNRNH